MDTYTHTIIHAYAHTLIHTYTHAHILSYTHTSTHTQWKAPYTAYPYSIEEPKFDPRVKGTGTMQEDAYGNGPLVQVCVGGLGSLVFVLEPKALKEACFALV